ncbi:MAG: glutathione S-transferase [Hyphomicrobiales bacterium]|nr:glutathione S-transferase [Hyphomicrobiales bacterium]
MILVHHLRVGRSVFTVWLLEELGLNYELKIYERDRNMRAPADLKEAHPLGKSPVIEDGDLNLAESGAIAAYLVDTYDTDNLLAPPRDDAAARAEWTQWLHYSEGSAFAPLLMKLLLRGEQEPALIGTFCRWRSGTALALHRWLSWRQDLFARRAHTGAGFWHDLYRAHGPSPWRT